MPYTSPTWANNSSPAISAENLQALTDTVAESQNWILTCEASSSTTAKTVTAAGFVISQGMQVSVTFTNGNTASRPTLNINNTGAYGLYSAQTGTYITSGELPAGMTAILTFDGQYWQVLNPISSAVQHFEGTGTIQTSAWMDPAMGDTYYTATINAGQVDSDDKPMVGPVKSFTDYDADQAIQAAWNLVLGAEATNDGIFFYAAEKPEVNIPVQWAVTRS